MKRGFVLVLAALIACTSSPPRPAPSVRPSPTPTTASPTPVAAVFDAQRVIADVRVLTARPNRLAASPEYDRAAAFVATRFASLGYRVERQRVPIPAGSSEGVPVRAGSGHNVIAYPPGYDRSKPHLIAGGHLDTVARSPGANDNASGSAAVLELARLARLARTRLPVVLIAWIGEERRVPGPSGAIFGSRFYLEHLAPAERRSLKGVMNLDMIGNGPTVLVCHNDGAFSRRFLDATLVVARRLGVPYREEVVTRFVSDHLPFQRAGIPISWLWSGEHPTVHTPGDVPSVVRPADLQRIGRVAWETLRVFAG